MKTIGYSELKQNKAIHFADEFSFSINDKIFNPINLNLNEIATSSLNLNVNTKHSINLHLNLNNPVKNTLYLNLDDFASVFLVIKLNYDTNINLNLGKNATAKVVLLTQPLNKKNHFMLDSNLEENARIDVYSAITATKTNCAMMDLIANHHGSGSISNLKSYGAAIDRGEIAVSIYSNVDENASKCEVDQLINSIVLNKKAKASGRPVLKIFNNDIVAHHGCAIGQISPEELFYLMSRGLTKVEALIMILNSFFNIIYNQIADAELKSYVQKDILKILDTWKLHL